MSRSLTIGQTSVQFTLPLRPEAGLFDLGLALKLFRFWELLEMCELELFGLEAASPEWPGKLSCSFLAGRAASLLLGRMALVECFSEALPLGSLVVRPGSWSLRQAQPMFSNTYVKTCALEAC